MARKDKKDDDPFKYADRNVDLTNQERLEAAMEQAGRTLAKEGESVDYMTHLHNADVYNQDMAAEEDATPDD